MRYIYLAATLVFFHSCYKEKKFNLIYPTDDVPAVYKKVYGASDIYKEGDFIIIKSNGLTDHKSPYYQGTPLEAQKYEVYNGSNPMFMKGPGVIAPKNYVFKIPLNPQVATPKPATPLGPIGIALNGVPFFNQYDGMGNPLGPPELNSFDQYNGHPTPMNAYHYHGEPFYLTTMKGKSSLMGFLLDGYPVYGPEENGNPVLPASLDACHGHTHPTADFPEGIYHYHITPSSPYINGNGFYGVPGTVTQ